MQKLGYLPSYRLCEPTQVGEARDILVRGRNVKLLNGISLTLDGIAKGFAVDLAARELMKYDIEGAIVNAGGDLKVIGKNMAPVYRRELCGSLTMLGNIKNMAMATSRVGIEPTEQFPGCILAADDRKLSPAIITVVSKSAWRADALTKVAAIAHSSICKNLVQELGGQLL
jgi:thiamine biosynthesis lipoprotein